MTYTKREKAILFLEALLNLEYKHKRNVIDLYEDIGELFDRPKICADYLLLNLGKNAENTFYSALNGEFIESVIEKYNQRNLKVITEVSDNYPIKLYETPIRPICLYALGNIDLLNAKDVFSIVGARKMGNEYQKLTLNLSNALSERGVVIVTGVAMGADLMAIKGGLSGGNIICVLAGGLDFIDGEYNRDYIKQVAEKGLVITEYPPEVPPLAYHYPIRNRIIAGLADATLIVSGKLTSGARHTANFALDYGREVFAFPYSPTDFSGELCNSLIKDGAMLVLNEDDVCSAMGYKAIQNNAVDLSKNELLIINSIKNGNALVDDIIADTGLKIFELMSLLSALEIKGVVIKTSGNEYGIAK